ncbi:NADP-dependent oxidoreductase [Arenibacter sp. GZD96]|uniref:NADP-dependent oxidoreductase n=1 Tax=Aurantibrevibacter litoralis TaxID=3106030 RepID=UPI002AFDEACB|nr:NADP-dependent oxidoreductase [Arenibacter sp. GZD-96]MEA1787569.1 NADP-dependent oxidoreductase [Arenibacter sp. GZD-96]
MTNVIYLEKRPVGIPKLTDFKFGTETIPELQTGQILLKTKYVSVDPYLRGRMNDVKSYIPPFQLGQPVASGCIAEVISSRHPDYEKGDFVSGILDWKEVQISKGQDLTKVSPKKAHLSAYLGVLGMTGLTAYLGLTQIGKPKKGETLFVSGAAGAVGSIVGQIGKIMGLKVVGVAGTDEKVRLLTTKFGFDAAFNYNTEGNKIETLAKYCPEGIDVYFDNVGGEISEAVLFHINKRARMVMCGAISMYNEKELPKSIAVQPFLVRKSALMQGFIIFDFEAQNPEALQQLTQWLDQGLLVHSETVRNGFDAIPQAFIDLFSGKNIGKMVVAI